MNKMNLIVTAILILALATVPVMYTVGMQRYKAQLDEQLETAVAQLRADNESLTQQYNTALQEALNKQAVEWERKHTNALSKVREALLNSGVTLDQLNAESMPEAPVLDLSIPQSVYESLKKGQSYEEVAEVLGRDGDNILNIEDTSGLTSSFEWRWDDANGEAQTLGITFINNKLNHKTYSAFVF